MSSKRQRSIPSGGRYRQVSLYKFCKTEFANFILPSKVALTLAVNPPRFHIFRITLFSWVQGNWLFMIPSLRLWYNHYIESQGPNNTFQYQSHICIQTHVCMCEYMYIYIYIPKYMPIYVHMFVSVCTNNNSIDHSNYKYKYFLCYYAI